MENPLQRIVANRLEELELNPFEAARRVGLERSFINDILIGKKGSVRSNKIDQLARALELHPQDLARDIATPDSNRKAVPLMGYLGAGGLVEPDYEQVPSDGLEIVEIPFAVPDDLIAFKVRGLSMMPVFKPDAIIIVYREQKKPIESFYGYEAAVRTSDGKRYIKTINRGGRTGTVNLSSWNDPQPIENVRLEWIGEIFAVLPPAALKKVIRQGGIQGQLRLKSA